MRLEMLRVGDAVNAKYSAAATAARRMAFRAPEAPAEMARKQGGKP